MLNLDDKFKELFPQCDFMLKDFQKAVITNVIENGNTLCVMQTGGGKSLIYCMAGLLLGGITIVVSPLTALINEQIEKIKDYGYDAISFPGELSPLKQMKLLEDIGKGIRTPNFIFLSPEKIGTDGFLEYCLHKRKNDIKLLAIDEIHCVSQWGLNFRPFYEQIPVFINNVFASSADVKVLGLTATLNPKERIDICNAFNIKNNNILQQELLMRSEVQLHVFRMNDKQAKEEKLWNILSMHSGEKILVYVYRKYKGHSVESLCQEAVNRGFNAQSFHGDMTATQRQNIIEDFRNNKTEIIFATNAFGMGIDIPDIRVVVHFMLPESLEQYYQEIGRAARDGKCANAYLMYTAKNIEVKRKYFIDGAFPSEEVLNKVYSKITSNKIGYKSLNYFEDEEIQQCLPYFIKAGLIEIECKGFDDLSKLDEIKDNELQLYFDSTKTKNFITTIKKVSIKPKYLAETVYASILKGKAKVKKALERWLILNIFEETIPYDKMKEILDSIQEKKEYKHGLLDYLVYVLDATNSSKELHQEIARYLGVKKHNLNRIYKTVDGNSVRSKSEVIISDLLHNAGIPYVYEEKLFYEPGKWIEPDFTITLKDGTKIYWEHVGMLGLEQYDKDWQRKREIYNTYFPNKLVFTYENGNLSNNAQALIEGKIL